MGKDAVNELANVKSAANDAYIELNEVGAARVQDGYAELENLASNMASVRNIPRLFRFPIRRSEQRRPRVPKKRC